MRLCSDASPFEFKDSCVRAAWSALTPTALVFTLCLFSVPFPGPLQRLFRWIHSPLQTYMTLHEAEALDAGDKPMWDDDARHTISSSVDGAPLWRTVVFAFVGLVEALCWLSVGLYQLINESEDASPVILPILMSTTWIYTVVVPIARPSATPSYDLFAIYCAFLFSACFQIGGVAFDHSVLGLPWPSALVVVAAFVNVIVVVGLLAVILNMPMDIPSKNIVKEDIGLTISPEDYTSLSSWLTFRWIDPLIKRGRNTTLHEYDIWSLSPNMQSRPIFIKFKAINRPTLFSRLWAANSLDIIVDIVLSLVSVVFEYAGPFFLKRILDEIDRPSRTPESQSRAYIYAFLAALCTMFRAESDMQHLWFIRRAAARIRSELTAAIYDKALKRKDYSGIIDKDKQAEAIAKNAKVAADKAVALSSGTTSTTKKDTKAKQGQEGNVSQAKGKHPKASADTGKIMNLMTSDTSRISATTASMHMVYGAPLKIIIAATLLFQMLGWSAFAGFVVIIASSPLNSYMTKRRIGIQKSTLAARDKRMGVLNEMLGAIKFIKFFAWEERWVDRVMDSRQVEMNWMRKARTNSVLFFLLWNSVPILVSIISFFVYVMQGKELTVSIAFTSIALFSMIRQPLNGLPAWVVQVLTTRIALDRVSTYLDEDEVTDQVSSLKKDQSQPVLDTPGLGIINASFKWNEVEERKDEGSKKKVPTSQSDTDEATAAVEEVPDVTSVISARADHWFELRDINVMFPEGELSVIVGPTASGKTALLMALLGEMTMLPGEGTLIMSKNLSKVDEHGFIHSISYAAQSPWLRHQSIKENILFGHPYDEERYNAVVECCALKPDLAVLEDGDETEIGARGVTLSGGQKARVALARAVYARTKYVLLDDPLSAVDSHTSRFLYERLLSASLLANRTVILVTHHVELVLPGAHYLVRMLDGRIDMQGTVKDLRARGVLEEITLVAAAEVPTAQAAPNNEDLAVPADPMKSDVVKQPRKLILDEHREVGGVKWTIYGSYLKASSYWIWGLLVGLVIIGQILAFGEKFWIMIWGESYEGQFIGSISHYASTVFPTRASIFLDGGYLTAQQQPATFIYHAESLGRKYLGINWPSAVQHPLFYVGIYAAIGLAKSLFSVLAVAAQYTGALRASRVLFQQLLVTVVRATFRFHDTTPQGRMLNRFGKDIDSIDSSLAGSIQAVNSELASLFASVFTVIVVFPGFLIPAFFIGLAYWNLATGYLNTGRDLRRMESNTRSPIYSGFGELLEGIVTVRAFSAEKRFLDELHHKVDTTTKMFHSYWMINRWLAFRSDCVDALAVLLTTLFAITANSDGAGLAGLSITSAMAFTISMYLVCRSWTDLELDLNSVERIVEYLDLPQEPPAIVESNRVPAYWPSSTTNDVLIRVENLVVKYAPDLPAVVQDVSFTLKAGERVGLLGRTGSGKSTLAMSILRFVDPTEGRIIIDGIDISTIGIYDLRSRLTFIPQDATLFSGTLRDNLDPFDEYEDEECLSVLHRVGLISSSPTPSQGTSRAHSPILGTSNSPSAYSANDGTTSTAATEIDAKTTVSLDTQVSAGGTNFSQGQRQLIVMARALLRHSSIIILDEATSSIDFAADATIQAAIREEFRDSLLLTVAHRLRTVIDYDRLIVLDHGKVAEFDTPWRLIQKEGGIFRNMCLQSGTFGELEAMAKASRQ